MALSPEMLTAVAAVVVAVGTLIGTMSSNNKTLALLKQRLDQIEDKVGQHNHLEARLIAIETQMKNLSETVGEVKSDIKRMEVAK